MAGMPAALSPQGVLLVLFSLDYCNSYVARHRISLLRRLKIVQNAAAHVSLPRTSQITQVPDFIPLASNERYFALRSLLVAVLSYYQRVVTAFLSIYCLLTLIKSDSNFNGADSISLILYINIL